ncbi:MAG: nucleotidyltransferase family protein [Holophaga sp.]|nr:nucleotidyltransferase family protein [Holophaga sp.]
MTRAEAIRILHKALPGLKERYGVQELALFGSVARDEAGPGSDIDVLVTFQGRTRFRAFMGLQFELEDLLGVKVDLATQKALKPLARPSIMKDLVHVP